MARAIQENTTARSSQIGSTGRNGIKKIQLNRKRSLKRINNKQ